MSSSSFVDQSRLIWEIWDFFPRLVVNRRPDSLVRFFFFFLAQRRAGFWPAFIGQAEKKRHLSIPANLFTEISWIFNIIFQRLTGLFSICIPFIKQFPRNIVVTSDVNKGRPYKRNNSTFIYHITVSTLCHGWPDSRHIQNFDVLLF